MKTFTTYLRVRVCGNRGYTLIELLVVIVVIAILASLVASQVIKVMDDANRAKTRTIIVDLKNAIGGYTTDYGRLPTGNVKTEGEWLTDGTNSLVDTLMGLPVGSGTENLNPRGTKFANLPTAQHGRHGILMDSRPLKLHDMWGKPFHILLDVNGDHQVANPDASNNDPRISQPDGKPAPAFLLLDIAIFSSGKDGIPRTADDIASWREP